MDAHTEQVLRGLLALVEAQRRRIELLWLERRGVRIPPSVTVSVREQRDWAAWSEIDALDLLAKASVGSEP